MIPNRLVGCVTAALYLLVSALCLSSSFVAVAVATSTDYSISLPADTFETRERASILWTAPDGHGSGDWIGLYRNEELIRPLSQSPKLTSATSGEATFIVPDDLGAYELRIHLKSGVGEPTPEARTTFEVVPIPYRVTVTPTVSLPNAYVSVSWTAPLGRELLGQVGFYLAGSPSGEFIELRSMPATSTSSSMSFRSPIRPGTYEFRIVLGETLQEPSPPARAVLMVAGPDLAVSSVGLSEFPAMGGETVSAEVGVENLGIEEAEESLALLFLSVDDFLSSDDVGVGNMQVPTLASGQGYTASVALEIPGAAVPGEYHLLACADAQGRILETSETNNCKASQFPIAVQEAGPELDIDPNRYTIEAPIGPIYRQESFQIRWTAPRYHGASDAVGLFEIDAPRCTSNGWPVRGCPGQVGAFRTLPSDQTSGVIDFVTNPSSPGRYELRVLLAGTAEEPFPPARQRIMIVDVPYSLSVSPSVAPPGQSIQVVWTAPYNAVSDRVALVPRGAANTASLSTQWLTSKTSGSLSFDTPAEPGVYEFRVWSASSGNQLLEPDPPVRATLEVLPMGVPTPSPTMTPSAMSTSTPSPLSTSISTATPVQRDVWIPIGPFGGGIIDLEMDSLNPSTLYAITDSTSFPSGGLAIRQPSGAFSTTTAAEAWSNMEVPGGAIKRIVVAPSDSSVLYAIVGHLSIRLLTETAGVYRSTDAGATWAATALVAEDFVGTTLSVDPQDPNVVVVGSTEGAFKTTDGGGRWTKMPLPSIPIELLVFDPGERDVLYGSVKPPAGPNSDDELLRSRDGGITWEEFVLPEWSGPSVVRSAAIVPNPGKASDVYVALDQSNYRKLSGVYLSAAGNLVVQGRCRENVDEIEFCTSTSSCDCGPLLSLTEPSVAADPSDGNHLLAVGGLVSGGTLLDSAVVWVTRDGGSSWTRSNRLGPRSVVKWGPIRIDPRDGERAYLATQFGVMKTFDGGHSWNDASDGLSDLETPMVVIDPLHPTRVYAPLNTGSFVVASGKGLVASSDGGVVGNRSCRSSSERLSPIR